MIRAIRLGEFTIPARTPIEFAAVDDDAANRGAVATNPFRAGVYDNINAMLDGTAEHWRKCIIHDRGNILSVCNIGDSRQIRNITLRVANRLKIDRLGVFLNRRLDLFRGDRVDKGHGDTHLRKRVTEKRVGAPVKR